jgi:hypothetical protein
MATSAPAKKKKPAPKPKPPGKDYRDMSRMMGKSKKY